MPRPSPACARAQHRSGVRAKRLRVSLDPGLEAKLRSRVEAEGLSVSAYLERLIADEDAGVARTEALLQDAAESGDRIELTGEEWDRMEREALADFEARSKRRA